MLQRIHFCRQWLVGGESWGQGLWIVDLLVDKDKVFSEKIEWIHLNMHVIDFAVAYLQPNKTNVIKLFSKNS